jgi:hypothetical protein
MAVIPGTTTLTKMPRLMEGAKLAFVLALREAFKSQLADENLRYSDNPDETKLRIYTAHPLQLEFYPAIVVSVGGGDASFKYLQDDFIEENEGDARVRYSGQMSFTISLTVLTNSTLERERIIDHLIVFVRHLFRDVLHGFNLEYTRDMRVGSENILEVENRPVYEQTFDIPVYLEYHADIDQKEFDTIRRIDVSDISTGAIVVSD